MGLLWISLPMFARPSDASRNHVQEQRGSQVAREVPAVALQRAGKQRTQQLYTRLPRLDVDAAPRGAASQPARGLQVTLNVIGGALGAGVDGRTGLQIWYL